MDLLVYIYMTGEGEIEAYISDTKSRIVSISVVLATAHSVTFPSYSICGDFNEED